MVVKLKTIHSIQISPPTWGLGIGNYPTKIKPTINCGNCVLLSKNMEIGSEEDLSDFLGPLRKGPYSRSPE